MPHTLKNSNVIALRPTALQAETQNQLRMFFWLSTQLALPNLTPDFRAECLDDVEVLAMHTRSRLLQSRCEALLIEAHGDDYIW